MFSLGWNIASENPPLRLQWMFSHSAFCAVNPSTRWELFLLKFKMAFCDFKENLSPSTSLHLPLIQFSLIWPRSTNSSCCSQKSCHAVHIVVGFCFLWTEPGELLPLICRLFAKLGQLRPHLSISLNSLKKQNKGNLHTRMIKCCFALMCLLSSLECCVFPLGLMGKKSIK